MQFYLQLHHYRYNPPQNKKNYASREQPSLTVKWRKYCSDLQFTLIIFYRKCFFTSDVVRSTKKFLSQLNHSFGSGGMCCGFDSNTLFDYVQHLNSTCEHNLPVKKAVLCSGQQPDGMWVINDMVHI